MRIGENLPPSYTQYTAPPDNAGRVDIPQYAPADTGRANYMSGPGVLVDLSPEARAFMASAAYNQNTGNDEGPAVDLAVPAVSTGKTSEAAPTECQTCKNRRYVDQSDDSSVSFQTPTNISPGESASAVRSHEYEHVANEQAKADRDGRRVVSQTVTIETSICPECGRVYVSGGVTRTITASDNKNESTAPPAQGQEQPA